MLRCALLMYAACHCKSLLETGGKKEAMQNPLCVTPMLPQYV